MSEAVESFNNKIEEIKEDREKFQVLMDEFFESEDMNIKELLAEMMFHIIMTRGTELQEKFEEIDKMRKMFTDISFEPYSSGGYITIPNTTNTIPNNFPQWSYTIDTTNTNVEFGDNLWINSSGGSSNDVIGGAGGGSSSSSNVIGSSNIGCSVNTIDVSDIKIQNIIDSYEKVSEKEYSDESFKSAIDAISTVAWSASSTG